MCAYRKITEATAEEINQLMKVLIEPESVKEIEYKKDHVEVTVVTRWGDGDESFDIEDVVELYEYKGGADDYILTDFPLNTKDVYRYKQWCLAHGFCSLYRNNPFVKTS